MSFQDEYKITSADRLDKGVYGLPDTPGMTTAAIQERFDSLGNLAIDKFNALVEAASDVVDGSDTKFPTNKAVQDYISGEGGAIIDDTTPSLHKAYSSQKVENMFGEFPSELIDDSGASATTVYSSSKVEEIVADLPTPESVIDDDTASTATTYSSSKLESDFISVSDTEEQTATDEFSTINGGLLSSLKVALSPNQDLHGYSEPWVGGSRKNKFVSAVAKTETQNGITVSTSGDGIYHIGGTASADVNISFPLKQGFNIPTSDAHTFYLKNTFDNGSVTLLLYNGETRIDNWSCTPLDKSYSNYQTMGGQYIDTVIVQVLSGVTVNGSIAPMIIPKTESDTSYEPWDNICPISGHTQVDVENEGKNLYNKDSSDNLNNKGLSQTTGDVVNANGWMVSPYIVVKGNQQYTYTDNGITINFGVVFCYYDSRKNFISSDYLAREEVRTIQTPANAKFVRFELYNTATDYLQFELGSTATPYVPYNGYQVTVNLGGTYYSGTLDVVTGELTARTAFKTFDGSEGWTANGTTGYLITRGASGMSDVKLASSANTYCLSNLFSSSGVTWADKSIGIENGTVWIGDVGNAVFGDLAGFKIFLSNTNLQLEYELATPLIIQLSPTMVKALVGENHLSAPLEGQEIIESIYSPLAKWNAVIDDTTASDDTTYSSNKINAIVPKIDDTTTSASKVFSSLKTANLITELSERFDFSTTEKPLGWWTDGKVYYGKVINIMGCPKEMFGLMVDLGVEVDTFIGLFAVGDAQDDNYNGGYCMGGTIYCKVTKSEGQNTQIQPACAVMALSRASLLVLYTKVEE